MADLIKSPSRDKKSLRDGVEHDGPAETGDMELLGLLTCFLMLRIRILGGYYAYRSDNKLHGTILYIIPLANPIHSQPRWGISRNYDATIQRSRSLPSHSASWDCYRLSRQHYPFLCRLGQWEWFGDGWLRVSLFSLLVWLW